MPCHGSIQTNSFCCVVFCQIMQYGNPFVEILISELSFLFLNPTHSDVKFVNRCPFPKPSLVSGIIPFWLSPYFFVTGTFPFSLHCKYPSSVHKTEVNSS